MKRVTSFIFCCALAWQNLNLVIDVQSQEPFFTDRSESSGLQDEFIYRQLGVSWADFDADGLMDVFIATTPKNRLFRNNGDHTFTDVAESAGVQDPGAEAATGIWGDYDADGDLDLFVGNLAMVSMDNSSGHMGVHNRLYRNDGGIFTNVAMEAGVSGMIEGVTGGTTSASWADFDGDNYIDLLVCNRMSGVYLYRNLGDGSFEHVSMQAGLHHMGETGMHHAASYEHAAWSDYDRDGDLDVFLTAGEAMTMSHMTMDDMDGMDDSSDMSDMDMNDMNMSQPVMSSNVLYQNQGDGTFLNVTEAAGLMYESNTARSHTAVWGDFNNDGYPDLFSGNRGSTTLNTVAKSRLYQNNQDGTFSDVTDAVGFDEEYSVFGADWADVNNDGMLDLYIAIHPDMRDHPDHHMNPTRIPHPLYMASSDGMFTDVNEELIDLPYTSGITDLGHQGGAAFADTDNDGDLDLLVVEAMGLGPLRYYENTGAAVGANWIQIQLQSPSTNTFAVGAEVIVEAAGQIMTREVGFASTGWGSQSPYLQTVGLGAAAACDVRVVWHDGTQSLYENMAVNQKHVITQAVQSSVQDWDLY